MMKVLSFNSGGTVNIDWNIRGDRPVSSEAGIVEPLFRKLRLKFEATVSRSASRRCRSLIVGLTCIISMMQEHDLPISLHRELSREAQIGCCGASNRLPPASECKRRRCSRCCLSIPLIAWCHVKFLLAAYSARNARCSRQCLWIVSPGSFCDLFLLLRHRSFEVSSTCHPL